MTLRVVSICGSLRAASSNAAVLGAAARLAPPDMEIVPFTGLAALPHFNPDIEMHALPPSVAAFRDQIGAADALLISSPEYAHGIAGSFKNGLDWLVGSLTFPGKPVGIINAAPRAVHAEEQLREILRTMSAELIEPAMLSLPVQGTGLDAAGIAVTPALAEPLAKMLSLLAEALRPRDA